MRSIRAGIQAGLFGLAAVCTLAIAKLGWQVFQGRSGTIGGEVLIIPMVALLLYAGWTAGREWADAQADRGEERNECGSATCDD